MDVSRNFQDLKRHKIVTLLSRLVTFPAFGRIIWLFERISDWLL